MQDETTNPGADAAQEPNNAPDPGAANPPAGEAEGLNQEAVAPEVAPDSAAASAPTDQGAGTFDPSVTMRPEALIADLHDVDLHDLMDPASPTDTDPAPSTDLGDPAPQNTGVAGPQGTPPVGDELDATDWGGWTEPDPSAPTDVTSPSGTALGDLVDDDDPVDESVEWDEGDWLGSDPSDTEVVSEPTFPEAVSMPHDVIMDPVPTDQEEAPPFEPGTGTDPGEIPDYEPGTGVIPDPEVGGESTQVPNLADQLNPDWSVVGELNGREYAEVQELLEDPSKLTDSEVLEDLSPDQMLAMMQAIGGYLSTPQTSVVGDPEDGGEVVEPSVVEDPDVIEEFPHGAPDPDVGESTGEMPDLEAGAPPSLNLADQIDPDWPVVGEMSGRDYAEVRELLEDPSKLSDLEALEDLSPEQMQVVMQAVGGYLSTPDPGEDIFDLIEEIAGEPEDGGEMVETAVMPDDELGQEPGTGVVPDAEAGDEPVEAPDASGAAVGGAAVGAGAVGAGAVGAGAVDEAGGLGGLLDGVDFGDIGGVLGLDDETVEDIGEAVQDPLGAAVGFGADLFGVDTEDISEVLDDPFGAATEAAADYLGVGWVGDVLEGDIGEAVLGGLGFSVGGPLGGVISEVAGDIVEEIPIAEDVFEAVEGVTEGLEQAAEEVVNEVIDDVGEAAGEFIDDAGDFFDSLW